MINWLRRWLSHRQGYQRGYRAGYRQSQEVYGRRREILEQLTVDAQQEIAETAAKKNKQGYNHGCREGRTHGHAAGFTEGLAEGRLHAYARYCQSLGVFPGCAPEVFEPPPEDFFWGPHANVYTGPRYYVLRIVVNGIHRYQMHRFKGATTTTSSGRRGPWKPDKADLQATLVKTLVARQQLLPVTVPERQQLLEEIESQIFSEHGTLVSEGFLRSEVARRYHERMLQRKATFTREGFLGDDPGARFESGHELLSQPWTVLFGQTVPKRYLDIFTVLGLMSEADGGPRTVRDLLLVTPEELDDLRQVGPKTILNIQQVLAHHGLALWGCPAPSAPPPDGRHLRAIQFPNE